MKSLKARLLEIANDAEIVNAHYLDLLEVFEKYEEDRYGDLSRWVTFCGKVVDSDETRSEHIESKKCKECWDTLVEVNPHWDFEKDEPKPTHPAYR